MVLEPTKGSVEIKEVVEVSPPPEDTVIAPVSAVKRAFRNFKIRSLIYKRRKKKLEKKRTKAFKAKKEKASKEGKELPKKEGNCEK